MENAPAEQHARAHVCLGRYPSCARLSPALGITLSPLLSAAPSGYGMTGKRAKPRSAGPPGRIGLGGVLELLYRCSVTMAGTAQPVLHRPPIPVPEQELVQGLNREGIHASPTARARVRRASCTSTGTRRVRRRRSRSSRVVRRGLAPAILFRGVMAPWWDRVPTLGEDPPRAGRHHDGGASLRGLLPSDKDGRAGRHRGVMTSRRRGRPNEAAPRESQAGASSTSLTRAGSILIPGPMVVETVTLRRYRPLAPAGLARRSSSITVR
jgi:hypothetical protein